MTTTNQTKMIATGEKRKMTVKFDVIVNPYLSVDDEALKEELLLAEQTLNSESKLRFHLKGSGIDGDDNEISNLKIEVFNLVRSIEDHKIKAFLLKMIRLCNEDMDWLRIRDLFTELYPEIRLD